MALEENHSPQPVTGAESGPDSHIIHRPFSVTLLIILGLSIVGFHSVRLAQTLSQWSYLFTLRSYLPVYLGLNAIAWAGIGLTVVWGLWKGRRWAPNAVRISFVAFLIYDWVDTLLVTHPAARGSNLAFIICLQIISLVFVFGILASPAAKNYFRRNQ